MVNKPFPASALIDYVDSETLGLTSEVLGLSYGACARWLDQGRHFTETEAEKWAQFMGVHPSAIWRELWWDAAVLEPA